MSPVVLFAAAVIFTNVIDKQAFELEIFAFM